MNFRNFYFLFSLIFIPVISFSQNILTKQSYSVKTGQRTLLSPWAGGVNAPQFSIIDLDHDGLEDLFVFDRTGNTILTFLNIGTPNNSKYIHAPQYQKNFPSLSYWAFLIDYNCDGIKDIFTSFDNGLAIYKGKLDGGNNMSFDLITTVPKAGTSTFLIPKDNLPSFIDVNNDGDIDALYFESGGGYINYYENQSKELFNNCDSLIFELEERCWGKIFDASDMSVAMNITCPQKRNQEVEERLHSGNTICTLETNGDNAKEVLAGNISFPYLNLMMNGGDSLNALIIEQDTTFPSNSISVNITNFPAAFNLDVDNDGLKDILAAPNAGNFSINNNNVWFYKNTGTTNQAVFTFQTDSFLTKDMIDVGESAMPIFFDYNADGLLDLLIGNYTLKTPLSNTTGITLFKNNGTFSNPSFDYITNNFTGLSVFTDIKGFFISFGDLDDDSDLDMVIGDGYGPVDGTVNYFENTAGAGNPANFIFKTAGVKDANGDLIDVGQNSTPQLVDVNRDGKLDLVIGERNGNLNYYENTGTKSNPLFTLVTNSFGSVDVQNPMTGTGYSTPFLTTLDATGKYYLLVGSEKGYLYLYNNIDGNLLGSFTLIDTMFGGINEGQRSSVSGADINNDGKIELVIGNQRGGIAIYSLDSFRTSITEISRLEFDIMIFPNPFSNSTTIRLTNLISGKHLMNEKIELNLYDILGREIKHTYSPYFIKSAKEQVEFYIQKENLFEGIFFCKIKMGNKFVVKKLIVQ